MGKTLFVGIDPAPRDAGISLLVQGETIIRTENFSTSSLKSCFANWFIRSSVVTGHLIETIESVKDVERKVIIIEHPPPRGIYAPALYGLDYMILDRIRNASVILAHPVLIQTLAGKRIKGKISKKILKALFTVNDYSMEKARYSDHEADATVLMLWGIFNITRGVKLPELEEEEFPELGGLLNFNLKKWTWRINKVDLFSTMEKRNVKLFDYVGSENAIRK